MPTYGWVREDVSWTPDLGPLAKVVKCPALSQPMERGMTKSRKKFDAAFKAKIAVEVRCARMRRFRNWRPAAWGASEPRSMPGRSRFSTMRASLFARGERFWRWRGGARARDAAEALRWQDRPTDGRTGFLGQEARAMSASRSKSDGPNGLARTCRCAANARLWAWRARGSTAPSPSPRRTIWR